MPNLDSEEEKWECERPKTNTKGTWQNGQKGKGKGRPVHFSLLESEEMAPRSEEIPATKVNFASRFINLANVMGAGDWGRKDCAEERSSTIDA